METQIKKKNSTMMIYILEKKIIMEIIALNKIKILTITFPGKTNCSKMTGIMKDLKMKNLLNSTIRVYITLKKWMTFTTMKIIFPKKMILKTKKDYLTG
jgi:hypothetical protein